MNIRRILAISKITSSTILRNPQQLMMPLMSLAVVVIGSKYFPSEMLKEMPLLLITLGISLNLGMGSIFMSSLSLAEEKEHNTLNALMTSSVSSIEYIIGSLLPPLIINVAMNVIFIPFALPSEVSIPLYVLVTTLGTLISLFVGMLIGVFSKTQMSCYSIVTPVLLVLGLIPAYAAMNGTMATISSYIYVGSINTLIGNMHSGVAVDWMPWIVMGVWAIIAFVTLTLAIKKKGLEG